MYKVGDIVKVRPDLVVTNKKMYDGLDTCDAMLKYIGLKLKVTRVNHTCKYYSFDILDANNNKLYNGYINYYVWTTSMLIPYYNKNKVDLEDL